MLPRAIKFGDWFRQLYEKFHRKLHIISIYLLLTACTELMTLNWKQW